VRTQYDKDVSFTTLHTYGWRGGQRTSLTEPKLDAQSLDAAIHRAVDAQLAAKGFVPAAPGARPDFEIAYRAVVEHRQQVQQLDEMYLARTGRRWYYDPWVGDLPLYAGPSVRRYEFDEGTLILDVVDPARNELLWRGTADSVLNPKDTAEQRAAKVDEAVTKVLQRFPPKSR
jgi:hypothetical protein